MSEPSLKQYSAELAELKNAPPCAIEILPLQAIAIVSHVQLALRHPSLADNSALTKIARDVALQLQALFNSESATYKVLELGWNSQHDILVEGTDFDDSEEYERRETIDDYVGEAVLDRFIDPEELNTEPSGYW
jgi:hypothetical protein